MPDENIPPAGGPPSGAGGGEGGGAAGGGGEGGEGERRRRRRRRGGRGGGGAEARGEGGGGTGGSPGGERPEGEARVEGSAGGEPRPPQQPQQQGQPGPGQPRREERGPRAPRPEGGGGQRPPQQQQQGQPRSGERGPRPPREERGPRPPRPEGGGGQRPPQQQAQPRRDERSGERGPRPPREERGPRPPREERGPGQQAQGGPGQAQPALGGGGAPRRDERREERGPRPPREERGPGQQERSTRAPREERRPPSDTSPPPSDLDAGWDDLLNASPLAAPSRARTPDPARAPAPEPEDDAPAPDIKLAPDLPPAESDPDGEAVFSQDALDDLDLPGRGALCNVVGIKFHESGKVYDADAGDASYARGDRILVDTERGPTLAVVAFASTRRHVDEPLRRVTRRADARDLARAAENEERAVEYLRAAKERVRERRMPVKMFSVELAQTGGKATFYFSSDDRIDFRELVRDLSQRLKLRIEMRQIGARDEAKMVGGIGSCGRELCCTTFLPRFDPVSIKMAKDQGLVLNPSKVSGQCGRLKCCLVYEQAAYSEMRKGLPKLGKRVITPAGEGRVSELDVLRRRVRVSFAPGEFEVFPAEMVTAVVIPPPEPRGGRRLLPVVAPDDDDEHEHEADQGHDGDAPAKDQAPGDPPPPPDDPPAS